MVALQAKDASELNVEFDPEGCHILLGFLPESVVQAARAAMGRLVDISSK